MGKMILELDISELAIVDQALDNERVLLEFGIENNIGAPTSRVHLKFLEPVSAKVKAKLAEVTSDES